MHDGVDDIRTTLTAMEDGDQTAFDRFFDRHAARLLIYINYNMSPRLRRKLDPSDILQNVYLRILSDFRSFHERARERSVPFVLVRMADHELTEAYRYFFKVKKRDVRREVTEVYIAAENRYRSSPLDWVPVPGASVSARIVLQEEYERVMGLLRELAPTEQYVTVARVIEGASVDEIARRVGKSSGAVRMIVARARDKLRDRVARESTN